jgi:tetratricopeptide (TPR) repeat protein
MRKTALLATVALATLSLASSQPARSQADLDQQFGTVHFETSCNEVAQRRFDRAMRYQHSYWYLQAKEIFEEAAKADPNCAMAHWGVALSLLNNPHSAIPQPNLAPGLAAILKAKAMNAKTERERDYIDALALMYVDHDKLTHRQRIGTFLKAMEALAAKYPKDDEAQILYAMTLNTSANPADKTYAQQAKGAAILEPIVKRLPRHPDAMHYLIHLYDYPPIAHKGLDAANRYAKIAPSAPHAQHMPSHIFTRVGYWKESIESNAASVKAAKAEKSVGDYLHAMDYMVYAYLQLGQDEEALAVVGEMLIVDIQRQVAAAWLLHAEGKFDEALNAMSAAADAEDKTEKAPVTPGPLAPARELYGFMLLERGMTKEALAAFEATKAKEPNRFLGFAGAAQAAEKLGDKAAAKANYEKLVALANGSGANRPELAAARKYLATN